MMLVNTVLLENGLYIQNSEKVDEKIVGYRRCLQRLAQYENLFEKWGIGELEFDELEKWHKSMLYHFEKSQ